MLLFYKSIEKIVDNVLIKLIPMTYEDLNFVNDIRNDISTRTNLRNTNKISIVETQKWFKNESPKWFIIIIDDKKVGYIRTSHITRESICIGCDIHSDYRRRGYAFLAYKTLISHLYDNDFLVIWLEVFKNNKIALSLYKKLNFIEINSSSLENRERTTMVHVR